jgi:hypothetical protein
VAPPFRTNAPPFEPRSGVEPAIRLRPDSVREPDPADRLPSRAAAKLRQLITANEDAHAVRQAIFDRRVELQAERGRLDTRIRHLTAQRLEDDDPSVVQARADLEGVKADLDRLSIRERGAVTCSLPDNLIRYIGSIPRQTVILLEDDLPEPTGTLDEAREVVTALKEQLTAVRCAPLDAVEQRVKMRAQIEDIAERGRVTVSNGEVVFPVVDRMHALQHAFVAAPKAEEQQNVVGKIVVQEPDLLSIFVRINKSAILKDLESQVEEVAGGLTGQERAERVHDLLSDILAAERIECALAERTGAAYRPDTDPRAVLGLSGDLPLPGR